ncbi:MAG TPA: DUF3592 domain-containing protein [Thermoanaerobaculia bacterium]|nr:DUF3592 domain-containing protein [Thermoanaerobaculia bacterium]
MILAVLVLLAAGKFDTSTIAASRSTIHPLETIDYTITVRNTGDSAPSYLRVANAVPTSAMFVSASPDWKFIEADRELSWMGNLPPGASKVLTLSLVTRPESSGLTLANRAAIHYDGSYWAVDHDLEIDTPPATGGMKLGAIRISTAGLVVFGYIGLALVLSFVIKLVMLRKPGTLNAGLWLIFLSIGFLLMFAHMAWRDSRMKSRFVQTNCTVVDSMARYQESQSASTTRSRNHGGTWSPLFAVRYPTPAGNVVSIGYASESRLQIGSPKPTEKALASLPRGAEAPCWYDPEEPKKVVLTRSFGGAYGFAVIPLLTLVLGIALLRRG